MRRLHVLVVYLLLAGAPLSADELRGRVVGVTDGDTLTLLDDNRQQHKIRLNGIDAPESGQAFGQISKQHLSSLVFGQNVVVVWSTVDLYGRKVGTIIVGQVDANLEQLRAGLAWYYKQYERDVVPANRPLYTAAEADARASKRGLWRDVNPQSPWTYRHPGTSAPKATSAAALSVARSAAVGEPKPAAGSGSVIGNRNSKIYHVPGCMDYDRVAERNRVYFKTEADAEAAGFRKAKNCN